MKEYLSIIENRLNIINRKLKQTKTYYVLDEDLGAKMDLFKDEAKSFNAKSEIYDYIINYIQSHKIERFLKKNGKVNESKFYEFVPLQKETWYYEIKNNSGKPPGETIMLRLLFALQMSTKDACFFMRLAGYQLNPINQKYRLVMALLDLKRYDRETVYDAFEFYGKRARPKFKNIY